MSDMTFQEKIFRENESKKLLQVLPDSSATFPNSSASMARFFYENQTGENINLTEKPFVAVFLM